MSPAEWATVSGWQRQQIPVRVVLTALRETQGLGKTLAYYDRPVKEEARRVCRAVP